MPVNSDQLLKIVRCPVCKSRLAVHPDRYECQSASCLKKYRVIGNTPILVDESMSSHRIAEFAAINTARKVSSQSRWKSILNRLTPAITRQKQRNENVGLLLSLLRPNTNDDPPVVGVLRIGTGSIDHSFDASNVLLFRIGVGPAADDVDFAADHTSLPLADGSCDAIVIEGAFGGVSDPAKLAAEVHRLLRDNGLLYVEALFNQQSMNGPFDLYRFSALGLRRLCRSFEAIRTGVLDGSGSALASSWRALLWSSSDSRRVKELLATIGGIMGFALKLLDRWLGAKRGAVDSAASVYFLGRRSHSLLSDTELFAGYSGGAAMIIGGVPLIRPATEVFSRWAASDLDLAMQLNHEAAVAEMLAAARAVLGENVRYSAIDAGCGNGWIIRMLKSDPLCDCAIGVDGSAAMISKARAVDPHGNYVLSDLKSWVPDRRVDLVISMEVIYYFEDPIDMLRRIRSGWLIPGGYAVIGIDVYLENVPSLKWPKGLGVTMTTWSEAQWLSAATSAGFVVMKSWRAAAGDSDAGTLAMLLKAAQ